MLLIDDEADNASINTKYGSDNDDPTKINKDIREILISLPKVLTWDTLPHHLQIFYDRW